MVAGMPAVEHEFPFGQTVGCFKMRGRPDTSLLPTEVGSIGRRTKSLAFLSVYLFSVI